MPKQRLTSPVALITGAARRIGAEIAKTLHREGFTVILHYHRSKKEALALAATFNKRRAHSAYTLAANLAVTQQLAPLVKKAVKFGGRLDVLVNNASCFYRTPLPHATLSAWDDLMDTNLKAPFFLSQAAAPYLAKQHGSIINIVDIHHARPMKDYAIYSITKAGLHMLTQSLAKELGPAIRVNAVSPGNVIWPEHENAYTATVKKNLVAQTSLKRAGHASDIAKTVLFLIQSAPYITGQDIPVDGGRSLFI